MADDPKQASFFTTLPGIITAFTGLIAAVTAMVVALHQAGLLGGAAARPPGADVASEPVQEAKLGSLAAPTLGVAAPAPAPTPAPAPAAEPAEPVAATAPPSSVAAVAPAPATRAKPAAQARTPSAPPKAESQEPAQPAPTQPVAAASVPANAFLVLVLDGDSRVYFVTRDNQILGGPPGTAPTRVGTRIHPKSGEYPWMLVVNGKQYVTNGHLAVFSLSADGTPTQVGHTQKL